jgi:hypothetical protein
MRAAPSCGKRAWAGQAVAPCLAAMHRTGAFQGGDEARGCGEAPWPRAPRSLSVCLSAGAIFFSLAFFAFASVTTVDLLVNERRLVEREVRSGYYRPVSYLAAKGGLCRQAPSCVPWRRVLRERQTGSQFPVPHV